MGLIDTYMRAIDWIGTTTGFPDALLHVHAGLLVMIAAALIARRPLSSPLPLAMVYAAELANEVMDRFAHGHWMPDTFSDVLNTVYWPTVIYMALQIKQAASAKG